MDDTYNDLYPLQLKDPEIPVQEDCSNDTVPAGTTNMEGKKKVLVPELITMTKVLFDRYRLDMYTYLKEAAAKWRSISAQYPFIRILSFP